MTEQLEALRTLREKEKAEGRALPQGIEHGYGVALHDFIISHGIKNVLETGVYHGFSAYYILLALQVTVGRLVSLELAPKASKDLVVPMDLRKNWTLVKGCSPDELYQLFKQGHGSDLFIHDSKHVFEVQFSEYMMASKYSKYIASHDIERNGAWKTFLEIIKPEVVVYSGRRFEICKI